MQAVILTAGKSTRTYPLTLTRPKPLLKAANKTLLEHNFENLMDFIDEIILIVGYKKAQIINIFGSSYNNYPIEYVEQKKQLGTAHALSLAERYIDDRFILLMGDDIYLKEDIKNCLNYEYSILTTRVKNPQNFGVIIENNGIVADFIEKPKNFVSNLVSTAFYTLDKGIFSHIKNIKKSKRNELELPDAIKLMAKEEKIYCVKSKGWLPIVYAWDLLSVDRVLRKNKTIIGNNSKIYGYVKNSCIGNNCIIHGSIKNSIVMDNTTIGEGSIVEDSVIGENVYFKGKIIAKDNAFSEIKNKKIKVNRLGAIIADNVSAKDVTINAGCKVWPNKIISNRTIERDLK